MKEKYSYLSKNVLLFTISGFIPKILAFLLVPIYTNYLSTGEYGVADLISTTVSLLLPIFTLDIQDAVMRFALDNKYQKADVFTTALKIIFGGFVCVTLGVGGIVALKIFDLDNIYLLFLLIMYLISAMYNSISLFCRGIDKVNVMTISSVLNSVVTLGTSILFLVFFKWGLIGYLAANIAGTLVALIYCFFAAKLYRYINWKVPVKVRKDMVAYSFPLIFNVIAWWVNNAVDRYIISWMLGVSVSGLYAISYKIPNLLSMFQNIFAQAWSISAIKEYDKNDSDGFIGNMYTMMNCAMVFMCSILMIMNIPIAKILYSKEFFSAWRFVPPLLISVVFNAMALFIGSIFTAVKDTKTLSYSTVIGALANIVCNFIFIYFWGAYGASIATAIGYLVTFVMRHIILRKHICIRINWKRDIGAYFCLLMQMLVSIYGLELVWLQGIIFIIIIWLYKREILKLFHLCEKIILRR